VASGFFPGDASRAMPYASDLDAASTSADAGTSSPLACFRLVDEDGRVRGGADGPAAATLASLALRRADVERLYGVMVRLSVMDSVFFDAQRQVRRRNAAAKCGGGGGGGGGRAIARPMASFSSFSRRGASPST
jgi:hypothetical protein